MKFTQEQLETLLNAQDNLNIKYLSEEWRAQINQASVCTAIQTEVAEYLESAPRLCDWKWWKPTLENDYQNMVVETVDVLHFLLTSLMLTESKENILNINAKISNNDTEDDNDIVNILGYSSLFIIDTIIESNDTKLEERLVIFYTLLEAMSKGCNRTLEGIYNGYFKKNELNRKRIDNGYREGTYQKLDEDGNEDNKKLEV